MEIVGLGLWEALVLLEIWDVVFRGPLPSPPPPWRRKNYTNIRLRITFLAMNYGAVIQMWHWLSMIDGLKFFLWYDLNTFVNVHLKCTLGPPFHIAKYTTAPDYKRWLVFLSVYNYSLQTDVPVLPTILTRPFQLQRCCVVSTFPNVDVNHSKDV